VDCSSDRRGPNINGISLGLGHETPHSSSLMDGTQLEPVPVCFSVGGVSFKGHVPDVEDQHQAMEVLVDALGGPIRLIDEAGKHVDINFSLEFLSRVEKSKICETWKCILCGDEVPWCDAALDSADRCDDDHCLVNTIYDPKTENSLKIAVDHHECLCKKCAERITKPDSEEADSVLLIDDFVMVGTTIHRVGEAIHKGK